MYVKKVILPNHIFFKPKCKCEQSLSFKKYLYNPRNRCEIGKIKIFSHSHLDNSGEIRRYCVARTHRKITMKKTKSFDGLLPNWVGFIYLTLFYAIQYGIFGICFDREQSPLLKVFLGAFVVYVIIDVFNACIFNKALRLPSLLNAFCSLPWPLKKPKELST